MKPLHLLISMSIDFQMYQRDYIACATNPEKQTNKVEIQKLVLEMDPLVSVSRFHL